MNRVRLGIGAIGVRWVVGLVVAAVTLTLFLVVVTRADGYRTLRTELNDGGIWVTNNADGFYGRVNKPVGQLDSALFVALERRLDVVQDGAAIVGVSNASLAPIDPSEVEQPSGESAQLPSGAMVDLRGGTLAVLDPATGDVRATTVDPVSGLPQVTGLDVGEPADYSVGEQSTLAVTSAGSVVAASTANGEMTWVAGDGTMSTTPLEWESDALREISAVGESAVVLDAEAGRLEVVGGPVVEVPPGSRLQQPGPDASEVLVSTSDRLLAVDLATGEVTEVLAGGSGSPAAPVRLGVCVYAAWSSGNGTAARTCEGQEVPDVNALGTDGADLVFRVNRNEILLNDRVDGAVWSLDAPDPIRMDDWEAFRAKTVTEDDESEDSDQNEAGDRRPPKAEPDAFGARPGRTTVLYPLDNDTAPKGRLLAITGVRNVRGSDADVTIAPDGQTVQIRLTEDRGPTTFDYDINDGRDVGDSATVTITPRSDDENEPPRLRDGYEPREWVVAAGGTIDIPVLPDWRDPRDGDPRSLVSATTPGSDATGAEVRTTAQGRIRFTAPNRGGRTTLAYEVADGVGEPVTAELDIAVQDPTEQEAFPAKAEPDVVSGEVGSPITIRPLANDLPGSDPLDPEAQLELAGNIAPIASGEVETDLVNGTITLTSTEAETVFLDYNAKFGDAPFSPGRIRVDVRAPRQPPEEPVALPDSATVYGRAGALVDVLANDLDPAGGLLQVQRAQLAGSTGVAPLQVAVVAGRWLRLTPTQSQITPQLVRYEISNGANSATGEVVVTQRPVPEDSSPVTAPDRMTVRAGRGVRVPVLDNDFSPTGDDLLLVPDPAAQDGAAGRLSVEGAGDALISGRFVSYLAPPADEVVDAQTATVTYVATTRGGRRSPGELEVTVLPATRDNNPPEPPTLQGRTVSGDTTRINLPGGVLDPDGDPVTLTAVTSQPKLGRIREVAAAGLVYQAYPGSIGTDEFTYELTDPGGQVATGTVRVGVASPGAPQPPQAIPDAITVEPGRTARIDVLANDDIAPGDRVTLSLRNPIDGVSLASEFGPIEVDTTGIEPGRNVEVGYEVTNGVDSSRGQLTVRTARPYNNPPVVLDAFGDEEATGEGAPVTDGDLITIEVLGDAFDPDGPDDELRIASMLADPELVSRIEGDSVTVQRTAAPQVVPVTVVDADGGEASANVFVPALDDGAPLLVPGAGIALDSGETQSFDLADYVTDPAGGAVAFTLKNRISGSPVIGLSQADILDETTFQLTADAQYGGPASVSFEVTTAGPEPIVATVDVPVQIGEDRPVLTCPTDRLEVVQGERVAIDVASVCHVFTADPNDEPDVTFTADWVRDVPGIVLVTAEGPVIEVAAESGAVVDTPAAMTVTASGSEPATLEVVAVAAPPPVLAPIDLSDLRAGESRTIDIADYLTPGVSAPDPTVVDITKASGPDANASADGSQVTITAGDEADGRVVFDVTASDVADPIGSERLATGQIVLEILDDPDAPIAPVVIAERDGEVTLRWQAPDDNGSPITGYEVRRAGGGPKVSCAATRCDVRGLTNGQQYRFEVRARNAIGWSEYGPASAPATPDAKPGLVQNIRLLSRDDQEIGFAWDPPVTQTSAIEEYIVSWPGGNRETTRRPRFTATGLDNNTPVRFSIIARNQRFNGDPTRSPQWQSIGDPGTPEAPAVQDQETPGDNGAVTLTWPAVDPNGPDPVRYTVTRSGAALAQCTSITQLSCDDTGIPYDGATYEYRVIAVNENGEGKRSEGPPASWRAVGQPADWQPWQSRSTGSDNQAEATFTVPNSRGGESIVTIVAGGQQVFSRDVRGDQVRLYNVPNNDRAHEVYLTVCNEDGRCSQSATRSVQTYGPLRRSNILSVEDELDGTSVRWRIRVDANGNNARVQVRANGGDFPRNEVFRTQDVDVTTFTTTWKRIGFDARESITVTLDDDNPSGRGSAQVQATSARTPPPPPPTVRVERGPKCNDGGSNPCRTGSGGTPCTHPSCGRVAIITTNFDRPNTTCRLFDNVDGQWNTKSITTNTRDVTNAYFGYPDRTIWAVCDGGPTSDHQRYNWPNS